MKRAIYQLVLTIDSGSHVMIWGMNTAANSVASIMPIKGTTPALPCLSGKKSPEPSAA